MTIEHSPFAPPALGDVPAAVPPPGIPTLPPSAPLSTPPPTVAAAPLPSAPTLVGTPHLAPPSTADGVPSPVSPIGASTRSTPPKRKRSWGSFLVLGLLVVATIAGAAWYALSAPDGPGPAQEPTPSTGLDIAPQDLSNPLLVPIDDASDVVAEIDDNSEEVDALDALGLDETGEPVVTAEAVGGHRFTWNYGPDETSTVIVDTTTGNYAVVSGDGVELRHVDSRSFRRTAESPWVEVDSGTLEAVRPLGLDAPLTIDLVLDPVTEAYTSSAATPLDDGASLITAEVDAFAYSQAQPTERIRWMSLMGHPAIDDVVEPGDVVVVQAELAADGRTVERLTVTTSGFSTGYALGEIFTSAPAIDVPEV